MEEIRAHSRPEDVLKADDLLKKILERIGDKDPQQDLSKLPKEAQAALIQEVVKDITIQDYLYLCNHATRSNRVPTTLPPFLKFGDPERITFDFHFPQHLLHP